MSAIEFMDKHAEGLGIMAVVSIALVCSAFVFIFGD